MQKSSYVIIALGLIIVIVSFFTISNKEPINVSDSSYPTGNIPGSIPTQWGYFLGAVCFCVGSISYISQLPTERQG